MEKLKDGQNKKPIYQDSIGKPSIAIEMAAERLAEILICQTDAKYIKKNKKKKFKK